MRKLATCLSLVGCLLLATLAARVVEWRREQGLARSVLSSRSDGRGADPAPGATGSVIARIAAPAVGVDVVAFEGVDEATLETGAGHFPGTALPGEPGNSSFAGHRDVEFRGLRRIRPGDDVYVDTGVATFVYRVADLRVVDPDEVDVLGDRGGTDLTLITCYPFDWVGPAPRRFVVRAELRGRFEGRDGVLAAALAEARDADTRAQATAGSTAGAARRAAR